MLFLLFINCLVINSITYCVPGETGRPKTNNGNSRTSASTNISILLASIHASTTLRGFTLRSRIQSTVKPHASGGVRRWLDGPSVPCPGRLIPAGGAGEARTTPGARAVRVRGPQCPRAAQDTRAAGARQIPAGEAPTPGAAQGVPAVAAPAAPRAHPSSYARGARLSAISAALSRYISWQIYKCLEEFLRL